ncbi:MAG: SDR family oxidoreductase [Gemella sp.]|nr:SDR family oxidoreductase [Gemella sp.]
MKIVLITGASSGIGKELAYKYANDKNNLFLVARNEQALSELKIDLENKYGITVNILSKDLGKEESAREVYEYAIENNLQITTLVNNAGFGDYGEFVNSDLEKQVNMINLNVTTLTKLTHYFLKDMKNVNYGNIINLASVAAFMPGPQMSVYYATKAYVLSLTEALSEELKGSDIYVTALCPGPTKTEFESNASVSFSSVKMQSVKEMVDYAYKEFVKRKKVIIIPGATNRAYITALKFLPRFMVRNIINQVQSKFRR